MKLLFVLTSIFVLTTHLYSDELFRAVTVYDDSWEVTFREQGVRFRIEIDGIHRGTSGYLQRLRLLRGEVLRLTDKHYHLDIEPKELKEFKGIQITHTYHDRKSGEIKTKINLEAIHEEK